MCCRTASVDGHVGSSPLSREPFWSLASRLPVSMSVCRCSTEGYAECVDECHRGAGTSAAPSVRGMSGLH
eukprot:CAMPEP_0206332426 /NCGR_PEP_ID=MMETSP0106_2-20121207/24763_1 /ASSEMBLY_ACC=CAM_ASM_000206 /TAXON_ID=81532 /ORGANISM="Acanthoeca-like sp., Strain 10tr" /LENGTH=69 /DNA_ID=CAMNT_0053765285 /DNA_START=117 /DNA_END=323 /DNA_ORIENTATION=-